MTTTATHTMVGPLTASGTAQLPFDFQAISNDEVGVIKDGIELFSGYATFVNPDGTGYVTPNTSWGTSEVFIFSRPAFTQETEFERSEPFYPDALNHPFDILGRQILALRGFAIGLGNHGDIIVTDEDTWEIAPGAVGPTELSQAYLPIAGGTMVGNVLVPYEAYGPTWNGSLQAPTKDAVYDKIEGLVVGGGGGGSVDDTAYGSSWNGVTSVAPSKNAVYDKIEAIAVGGGGVVTFNSRSGTVTLLSVDVTTALGFTPANPTALANYLPLAGGILSGPLTVPDVAYGVGWDGSLVVPTRNAVYDKLEAVIASIPAAPSTVISDTTYASSWDGVTTVAPSKNAVYDKIETLAAGVAAAAPLLPREQAVTSSATVTPTFTNDIVIITAQAVNLTLANWSGTAVPNHGLGIRIKDAGTAVNISYGANYRGIGVSLPIVTVAGKTLYLGCIWNATVGKIDVVSVAQE